MGSLMKRIQRNIKRNKPADIDDAEEGATLQQFNLAEQIQVKLEEEHKARKKARNKRKAIQRKRRLGS